jgi:hypothetical protein
MYSTGDDHRVVVLHLDVVEGGIEREIVADLFRVALVAFEIVDRGLHGLAGFLAGAHGVYRMADHQQRLVRHHHFVVFDVVADQHQDLFLRHLASEKCGWFRVRD